MTKFTALTDDQADGIIKRFDRNGSGVLQYEEFVGWMTAADTDPLLGGGDVAKVLDFRETNNVELPAVEKAQGTWTAVQWLPTLGGEQSLAHIIRNAARVPPHTLELWS